jgi:hypothetical protein
MVRNAFTHISTVLLLTLSSTFAHAASMVRVVAAPDGRSLTIDDGATRSTVTLAGVEPLGAPMQSQAFLERTAVGSWVMLDRDSSGAAYAFRSPDGTMLNTLLIREGYARVSSEAFDHRSEFNRVELEARSNWRGAWRDLQSEGASRDVAVYLGELDPAKGSATSSRSKAPKPPKAAKAPRASRKRS